MGLLSTHTQRYTPMLYPLLQQALIPSHVSRVSLSASFPPRLRWKKLLYLGVLFCLPVCFSLLAFIFIFHDWPFLPSKLLREKVMESVEGFGREECRQKTGGGGLFWRRTRRIENGRWYEGGEMKKANLPVREEEWENECERWGLKGMRERGEILLEPALSMAEGKLRATAWRTV